MKRFRVLVALVVIVVVVGAGFMWWRTANAPTTAIPEETVPAVVQIYDSYDAEVHTISGSIEIPNPCTEVSAQGVVTGSAIRVDVTVTDSEGICLQLPETAEFEVEVEAPEEAQISVFVNGDAATIEDND